MSNRLFRFGGADRFLGPVTNARNSTENTFHANPVSVVPVCLVTMTTGGVQWQSHHFVLETRSPPARQDTELTLFSTQSWALSAGSTIIAGVSINSSVIFLELRSSSCHCTELGAGRSRILTERGQADEAWRMNPFILLYVFCFSLSRTCCNRCIRFPTESPADDNSTLSLALFLRDPLVYPPSHYNSLRANS